MSNSTAEYWDVDGVSLNTDVQNLTSWGGSRESPPDLRGSNKTVPHRAGDIWAEKMPDARVMELSGWLVGPTIQEARTKWRKLRALLWRPSEQFVLTRRWKDENGVLLTASGLAEYVSGLEPDVTAGGSRLVFKVKIRMNDPFFYGPAETVVLPVGDTAFIPKGDYPSTKIAISITGTNVAVAISPMVGTSIDNTFRYTTVPAGAVATIDVDRFKSTEVLAGNTTKTSGKVSHSGRQNWLYIPKRTNKIRLARTSGTGVTTMYYQPAYI